MSSNQTSQCRLLIFEGIMGSGKSTATRHFGEKLAQAGSLIATYTEAADPHPVRASDDLPDFFQPWMHVDAPELACRVREKWARYVEGRRRDELLTVMDGQLFHGDLTHLFMMEMTPSDITDHLCALRQVLAPLQPLVVYFRQRDLQHAVRAILDLRGADWKAYQFGWKLRSPFAVRRQLEGVEGFVSMYQDYRCLTDALFESLDCSKLSIETAGGDWVAYYRQVEDALDGMDVPV
jgi:hypothetical protein